MQDEARGERVSFGKEAAERRAPVGLLAADASADGKPELHEAALERDKGSVALRLRGIQDPSLEVRFVRQGKRRDGVRLRPRKRMVQIGAQLFDDVRRGAVRLQDRRSRRRIARGSTVHVSGQAICRRASSANRPFFAISSSYVPISTIWPPSR